MQLALYKGKGLIGNAFIRWWTGSQYSHCELVINGMCYSSSVQDKGVRRKSIDLNDGKWDVIDLPWGNEQKVLDYFTTTDSNTYGWLSLLFSQMFNRNSPTKGSQFCSEWAAAALGLPNPASYSPRTLGDLVQYLNGR